MFSGHVRPFVKKGTFCTLPPRDVFCKAPDVYNGWTMNLDTLNLGELFTEISDLAREAGVTSQVDWNGLVDEVLESHSNIGETNDDQDLAGHTQALQMMWAEYQRESGPESMNAVGEDPRAPHE